MKLIGTLLLLAVLGTACKKEEIIPTDGTHSNEVLSGRMLLVLTAPSVDDPVYRREFNDIVDFHVAYAAAARKRDNLVILVNQQNKRYYEGRVPADMLLEADVYDIWMRDFTTVNPENPVQFRYTWASMTQAESQQVQNSFAQFADRNAIERSQTSLLLDGGNIVDNYAGRVVTTTRFMTDNGLTKAAAKEELMRLLGAREVAIIPSDDPVLAHADGMLMWTDDNTLLVNDYSDMPELRRKIMDELNQSFPGVRIVEVPVVFDDAGGDGNIGSACGIHLNATATWENIYVPVFNAGHDQQAVDLIRQNTRKHVITIDARGVCQMGGSVRCLTWQLAGANARRLIEAARGS